MRFHYRHIAYFLLLFSVSSIVAQEVFICVWRNPERTMTRLFPDAKEYRTVNRKIKPDQREVIEKRLGALLLPGQQDNFQHFEMLGGKGELIGYVIASTQKGQYGAIEFVMGLDKEKKISGIYIQRARERDQEFKKKEFLDSFTGKSLEAIGNNLQSYEKISAAAVTVAQGIRKELITLEETN